MLKLVIEKELSRSQFAEIGRPYRIFRNSRRGLIAVCSHIAPPRHRSKWGDGAARLQHRVSLYDRDSMARLGVAACAYPVNHVAFHDTEAVLLISTGSYDGGFFYQGSLLRFDWKRNEIHRMLGEGRGVIISRYDKNAGISLLMRPRGEEEFARHEEGDYPDHHDLFIGLMIEDRPFEPSDTTSSPDPRLLDLEPCAPADFGFDGEAINPIYFELVTLGESEMAEFYLAGYERREGVWDLCPLSDDRIAVARTGALLEIWSKDHGLLSRFEGKGDALGFLRQENDDLLCHVLVRGKPGTLERAVSQLWKYSHQELTLWKAFDRDYSWCVNRTGWLLGVDQLFDHRDVRQPLRISPDGEIFPGPIGCEGDRYCRTQLFPSMAEDLYFIRKPPSKSYYSDFNYRLWKLLPTGEEKELGPFGPPGYSDSIECTIHWDQAHFLRACDRYDITARKSALLLELVRYSDEFAEVSIQLRASVTQMVRLPHSNAALIGHSDGAITVIDLQQREVMLEQMLVMDGLVSVPSVLAVIGETIIIGTDDGRLLKTRVAAIL